MAYDGAIKAEQFILCQFTGRHVSEDELVREAIAHGWHSRAWGTPPEDFGKLLAMHGVPVTRQAPATIFALAVELAQGHMVIAAANARHAQSRDPSPRCRAGPPPYGSAIVVCGIDTSDPNQVQVMVGDPAGGESEARYSLSEFLCAWSDGSEFMMVATREPAPGWLPEMFNFDYTRGHIALVAGLPFDQFLSLAGRPAALRDLLEHA